MKIIFKNLTDVTYTHLKTIVSTDQLRPVLCGACIDIESKKLVVTDSHVLVAYPIEIIENDSDIDHKIVPITLFNRLRYMGEYAAKVLKVLNVQYVLTDDYAEAQFNGELLYRVRYIDGKYPKYMNVMPNLDEAQALTDIGINPAIGARLFKGFPFRPDLRYKMTFFAKNKAIRLDEYGADYPITGIVMPTHLN